MNRVGEFEKVSFEQFYSAMRDEFFTEKPVLTDDNASNEDEFRAYVKDMYDKIELPKRATSGSAGYDVKSPFSFSLIVGEVIKIPTGIRVKIEDGWFLAALPRSGLGFKHGLRVLNTVGIIDSDYYYSDNEGHIFIKIKKGFENENPLVVNSGDGFAQVIFLPYGITESDDAQGVRNGGFGSTDKK